MNGRATGHAFVIAQATLIIALALVPNADHITVPGWLRTAADVGFWVGCIVAIIAAIFLGRSLTATPVPNRRATLRTTGPYRFVRHPIYSGVVMIVLAMAIRSTNILGFGLGAATVGFFHWKSSWEEARLTERFPEYRAYAARTPRFVPRPRRDRPDASSG